MSEKITSLAGLKKAIEDQRNALQTEIDKPRKTGVHFIVDPIEGLNWVLEKIGEFEAGLKKQLFNILIENDFRKRKQLCLQLLEGTAAGNDDKELEKRCEIAVKEVVEDSRRRSYEKRRAKSSKKAGKGRGKEKGAGSSPITSLGSAPAKRGDG